MHKFNLVFFLLVFGIYASAQNCESNHFRFCQGCENPYNSGGQSRSIPIEKGQINTIHILVYQNFNYCLQICCSENLENVFFRIKEDDGSQTIIYDSSLDNNKFSIEFWAIRTKKILIEIIVPEDIINLNNNSQDKIGCVDFVFGFTKEIYNEKSYQKQGY